MKLEKVNKDLLVLFGLALLVSFLNWIYLKNNTIPPHWDMGRHLWTSLQYLGNFKPSFGGLSSLYSQYYYYPPMTYIAVLPWYKIFGTSMNVAILSNIQWMIILSFSVYGIGKFLHNRKVGLTAGAVILTVPLIAGHLREFQIDVPLTAIVALSFYLMLKSNFFSNQGYSFLLGIVLGVGFFTKWTFGAFLLFPLLANVVAALYLGFRERKASRLINILVLGLAIISICGVWYYDNRGVLKIDFRNNAFNAGVSEGDPQSFGLSLLWLVNRLLDIQLFLPLATFSFVGIILAIIKKEFFKKNWQVLLLIISSALIFAKLGNKDVRYVMPYLTFFVIMATYWLFYLKKEHQTIVLPFFFLFIFLNLLFIQASFPRFPDDLALKFNKTSIMFFSNNAYTSHYPQSENWPIVKVLEDTVAQKVVCPGGIQPKLSIVGGNILKFNDWAFWYENTRLSNNLEIAGDKRIWNNEFMLIYGSAEDLPKKIDSLEKFDGNSLEKINSYPLPDGQLAELYKTKREKVVERPLCQ